MERAESKVCPACWNTLRAVTQSDRIYRRAVDRLVNQGHLDGVVSLWHFEKEGALQSMVHALKYDGITDIGVEMGRVLGDKLCDENVGKEYDSVIPVPLHRAKHRERGYNQSESIARGMQEVMDLPLRKDILHRTRFTQSQTELDAAERKVNVDGAFTVRNTLNVQGRSFLLVDDVITTGATIEACAVVLKTHGALRVFASSVALAE
jgi:ComF family protein